MQGLLWLHMKKSSIQKRAFLPLLYYLWWMGMAANPPCLTPPFCYKTLQPVLPVAVLHVRLPVASGNCASQMMCRVRACMVGRQCPFGGFRSWTKISFQNRVDVNAAKNLANVASIVFIDWDSLYVFFHVLTGSFKKALSWDSMQICAGCLEKSPTFSINIRPFSGPIGHFVIGFSLLQPMSQKACVYTCHTPP